MLVYIRQKFSNLFDIYFLGDSPSHLLKSSECVQNITLCCDSATPWYLTNNTQSGWSTKGRKQVKIHWAKGQFQGESMN